MPRPLRSGAESEVRARLASLGKRPEWTGASGGNGIMSAMTGERTDIDLESFKALLERRRADLVETEAEEEERDEEERGMSGDSPGRLSRVTALQRNELERAKHAMHEAELKRIDSALRRMDRGEYGLCVSCGDEISEKRLKADPSVATCIDCAKR